MTVWYIILRQLSTSSVRYKMEISFKQKRAIVTGGAQGIGRGIAVALSRYGARVTVFDNDATALKNLKNENPEIRTVAVDLCNWNATEDAIKTVMPADLLVNNAGVAILSAIPETTRDQFTRSFDINVGAVVNVTKLFSKYLMDSNLPGSIVNISSQASKAGLMHHGLYCASKGAVDAFTRAAALEFGPKNIRINCVNPTVVMTELGRSVWSDPKVKQPMLDKIPLKRFAEVEDVVNAVLFLLSDKASMIHGVCLPVDGGFTAC